MKALITRKVGMTSTINEDGAVQAITLLSVGDQTVLHHKTDEKDGYTAVQVGAETAKKVSKSVAGHVKNAKVMPKLIREFRITEIPEDLSVGSKISADVFSVGDTVQVTGTNKGKGWAGTIKRHNFHRQRATHGAKGNTRKVGSIGSMYPQRIFKGKKMAGQLGHTQVTTKNLKIALVDTEQNVIGVTGAVPGPKKSVVIVKEMPSAGGKK
ncbi:MAG TPA: 50S ribosomal protein L3 [Candidatus Saccharimonadales bacterium]|nr:50S ribosomal protein L3 [Candidatus Saccharimonadales bacterium]